MSSCSAAPSPWARKSTAQGRRRVSLRQREEKYQISEYSTAACESTERERPTKRPTSPVGSTAKRMRLVDFAEEEETRALMREEVDHEEIIGAAGREEEEDGAIDPDMQVTSSYSSSSGSRLSDRDEDRYFEEEEDGMGVPELLDVSNGVSEEEYIEEEDIEEEEEDDEDMVVDKTDIITSDEGEEEQANTIDGPVDNYERMQRFRKLSVNLCQRMEVFAFKEPAQLTKRCHGVGPADEVWSVLCHKDELHSICNEKYMEPHGREYKATRRNSPEPRATLIDWMQDVCWAEKLHRETFHLAIDYVDRVMAKGPAMGMYVRIGHYQLLGTTAIFLAAKYEEIYPPKVEDIVQYTDNACTVDQVRQLELIVLKVLEWELNVVTPLHWTHLFFELLTGNPRESTGVSSRLTLLPPSEEGFWSEEGPEELPATSATCNREEFIHLANVVDAVILHSECRKFTNRTLAAAVMYSVFDADETIEQVTGLSMKERTVMEAVEWVQPIAMYVERHEEPRMCLPVLEGIRPDAAHTIQQHRSLTSVVKSLQDAIEGVEELREQLKFEKEKRQRSAAIRLPH